jgi:UDP-N-acetylmuramoyl-L-alanyl-D-glutamate--2,6-diaminopimelate ligase
LAQDEVTLDLLIRAVAELPAWPSGEASPRITGLTADSRAAGPGTLFAALPGSRADGRAFIGQAVAQGAAAVLAPKGTAWPEGVERRPLVTAADPRRALALLAAAFHGAQPATLVAVTGTNGKTSTVDFLRQLWTLDGIRAASLGTLGLVAPGVPPGPSLTTPDPVALHAALAALARGGVTAAAMEASSHGIEQRRLDGTTLAAAGFSNLTRDHLDYHATMEAYRAAKLRLFDTLLPEGAAAVANADMEAPSLGALRAIAAARGHAPADGGRGRRGDPPAVPGAAPRRAGAGAGRLRHPRHGHARPARPLPGGQRADGRGAGGGDRGWTPRARWRCCRAWPACAGRMELAARLPNGAAAYVDYAHTPDALERLLAALRPHVGPGGRLHVVFGAGGDRDPGKRPLMGAACARGADVCWVTDDNPRSEDPAAIRRAVLAGCPGGIDAGERAGAIARALSALGPGDVLAVAGKGHESGQTIGGVTHPFDDVAMVRGIVRGEAA